MVKRSLENAQDFNRSEFLELLQKFNDNFSSIFLDPPNGTSLNKKVSALYDDRHFNAYLSYVAKSGKTLFEWSCVKNFFEFKLKTCVTEMMSRWPYDEKTPTPNVELVKPSLYVDRILTAFRTLDGIPFTIQRLAELLHEPFKHYKKANKFLRALEKNLLVEDTVTPDGTRSPPSSSRGSLRAEMISSFSAHPASLSSKRPRLEVGKLAQNGTDHPEADDEMDISSEIETPSEASSKQDNEVSQTEVSSDSVNAEQDQTNHTGATEYVEIAVDNNPHQDDDQINQEVDQIFWNVSVHSTCSDGRENEVANQEFTAVSRSGTVNTDSENKMDMSGSGSTEIMENRNDVANSTAAEVTTCLTVISSSTNLIEEKRDDNCADDQLSSMETLQTNTSSFTCTSTSSMEMIAVTSASSFEKQELLSNE